VSGPADEILLLNHTVLQPPADLIEAGFILLPHKDMLATALGRFHPPPTSQQHGPQDGRLLAVSDPAGAGHALRIVDAASNATVCSCTTDAAGPATGGGAAADLLGFVNCDVSSPCALHKGTKYYVVSNEAGGTGYFAVAKPGWSVSSGYSSWMDYDRNRSTVVGAVERHVDGTWQESVEEGDTMGVALNFHFH
jgi:hypothetical protein